MFQSFGNMKDWALNRLGKGETYLKYKQAIENIDNIMSFLFIEGDEKE